VTVGCIVDEDASGGDAVGRVLAVHEDFIVFRRLNGEHSGHVDGTYAHQVRVTEQPPPPAPPPLSPEDRWYARLNTPAARTAEVIGIARAVGRLHDRVDLLQDATPEGEGGRCDDEEFRKVARAMSDAHSALWAWARVYCSYADSVLRDVEQGRLGVAL
jgi:hypothetical protein